MRAISAQDEAAARAIDEDYASALAEMLNGASLRGLFLVIYLFLAGPSSFAL